MVTSFPARSECCGLQTLDLLRSIVALQDAHQPRCLAIMSWDRVAWLPDPCRRGTYHWDCCESDGPVRSPRRPWRRPRRPWAPPPRASASEDSRRCGACRRAAGRGRGRTYPAPCTRTGCCTSSHCHCRCQAWSGQEVALAAKAPSCRRSRCHSRYETTRWPRRRAVCWGCPSHGPCRRKCSSSDWWSDGESSCSSLAYHFQEVVMASVLQLARWSAQKTDVLYACKHNQIQFNVDKYVVMHVSMLECISIQYNTKYYNLLQAT